VPLCRCQFQITWLMRRELENKQAANRRLISDPLVDLAACHAWRMADALASRLNLAQKRQWAVVNGGKFSSTQSEPGESPQTLATVGGNDVLYACLPMQPCAVCSLLSGCNV